MAKVRTLFVCQECGASFPKWMGKCSTCQAWNTLTEELPASPAQVKAQAAAASAVENLADTSAPSPPRIETFSSEFNRLLGGGMVEGAVYLIGGDPGIGKSTLLLQVAAHRAKSGDAVLYISGEESLNQIRLRAQRLNLQGAPLQLLQESCLERILATMDAQKPRLVILDSIQTAFLDELGTSPGSVGQVREVGARLTQYCKQHEITAFLIGHVTKDGAIAGPKVLEHLVDAVLYFEGDGRLAFRLLRSHKNRFATTAEIAVFDMTHEGLQDLENPHEYLFQSHDKPTLGAALTVVMEGSRPFLLELQALVSATTFPMPRRTCTGVDSNRAAMLCAVLEKFTGLAVSSHDLFVNAAGGLSTRDPACDLAIVAAIASSHRQKAIPQRLALIGEVALTGEVRPVSHWRLRLMECQRLGIKRVILPAATKPGADFKALDLSFIHTLQELEDHVLL